MAELVISQHDRVVLQLSLDRSSGAPGGRAVFTLQAAGETLIEIKVDCVKLGLPNTLREIRRYQYSDPPYRIPSIVTQVLKQKLSAGPLWLQFKGDCGNLSVIPWERLLQSELGVPILRLPYFTVKPFSAPLSCLDIVLCTSSPVTRHAIPIEELLIEELPVEGELEIFIRRLLAAKLRDKVTIHVFADDYAFYTLRESFHEEIARNDEFAMAERNTLLLYDPEEASIDKITKPLDNRGIPEIENPWLLWMLDTLKGRSVDIVHFLGHGYLGTDEGALIFQDSPVPGSGSGTTWFVEAQQLTAFALRLGAWSVGFSSPVNNFSASGSRLLADRLARLRTGPVLLHEIMGDRDGFALAETYHFLCNEAQDTPPSSPTIALYCHPYSVDQATASGEDSDAANLLEQYTLAKGDTLKIMQSEQNTPAWIAASQRYIEQSVADLLNAKADSSLSSATQEGIQKALGILSGILRDTGSSGSSNVAGVDKKGQE